MPEIPGGHAGALFEQLAEIVLIAVSHFKGNVAGAHLGGFQQSFCLVDAQQGLLPGVYTVEATAQTADILFTRSHSTPFVGAKWEYGFS